MSRKAEALDDEILLQRYFDGELAPDEAARVAAALSEDDQLKLAALGEMRELLAGTLEAEAASVDLWAGLEPRLQAAGADDGRERQRRIRRWRERVRGRGAGASAAIVAAAAAAFLLLLQPWQGHRSDNDCDIETFETSGSVAMVLHVADAPRRGDGPTTVIWAEE